MTSYLGIDPGASGAIACITADGLLYDVADMPYADKTVLAPVLANIVRGWRNIDRSLVAYVEKVGARPAQGVTGVFTFGKGYGSILGVLGALEIPVCHVTPGTWKKAVGVTADKGTARRKAIDLFPTHADKFARVKDDGRAEAALIARYGHDHEQR